AEQLSLMDILTAIDDPRLFGPWFKDPTTWQAWRSFLAATFGLPMTPEMLETFKACTGRTEAPTEPAGEVWAAVGRRGGKSATMAMIATYAACFRDYRPHLARGEVATIPIIAADRAQARVIFGYLRGLLFCEGHYAGRQCQICVNVLRKVFAK